MRWKFRSQRAYVILYQKFVKCHQFVTSLKILIWKTVLRWLMTVLKYVFNEGIYVVLHQTWWLNVQNFSYRVHGNMFTVYWAMILQDWFIHVYKHVLFNWYLSLVVTKILSIIMQWSLDLICSWIQPVLCGVDKESGFVLHSPVGQHYITYDNADDPYML